ncbi:fasciclin domain-containing protein [Dyadobacter sp. CY323]|uniref:fasciclin domain-containing protein n=1 Tax=Dyadobacter sp. CY323 TaxID=2907302 RepID=UPI001F360AF1|nr:fasciclin domain-containing protein [Dyadobacter sp. CY323]MCE6989590.1 hypothetical protein [Dyadobacter sp. CY323]
MVVIAQADTNFTEVASLVLAADPAVATALSSATSGLTVFAPTKAAFRELYKTTPKATLLAPANRALLYRIA